jgi:hypothetical protein
MKPVVAADRCQQSEDLSQYLPPKTLACIIALTNSVRKKRKFAYLIVALALLAAIPITLIAMSGLAPPSIKLELRILPIWAVVAGLGLGAVLVCMGRSEYQDVKRINALRNDLGLQSKVRKTKWEWMWNLDPDPVFEVLESCDRNRISEDLLAHLYGILSGATKLGVYAVGNERLMTVLRAVQKVGDERAIPHVQIIADWKVKTPDMLHIRDAARECLIELERLHAEDQAHGNLLRPAANDQLVYASLLRAAGESASPDTNALVRPIE